MQVEFIVEIPIDARAVVIIKRLCEVPEFVMSVCATIICLVVYVSTQGYGCGGYRLFVFAIAILLLGNFQWSLCMRNKRRRKSN